MGNEERKWENKEMHTDFWLRNLKEEDYLVNLGVDFDVLLTVHLSIILVNDQLDVQFFYFIMRLLQSSTCFEHRRSHHQEVKLY